MKIFNIDEALKLPQQMKILHEALDDYLAKDREEWQKSNPVNEIWNFYELNQFQKSFGSTTGFDQAFEQVGDYQDYPGFSQGDGFKWSVTYKTFGGKFAISWQTILEGDKEGVTDTITKYDLAWRRQFVEFSMYALTAFFGEKVFDEVSKTYLRIDGADTVDGDTMNPVKNPIFSNAHTVVRKEGMDDAKFNSMKQSNKFYINVALDGSDPLAPAKIANGIHQIKTIMSKYFNDNGKRAAVNGRKKIVMTEDAQLSAILRSVREADNFSYATGKPTLNMVKDGFDLYETPYLDGNYEQPMPQFATGADGIAHGVIMLDPAYNKANHGPTIVRRRAYRIRTEKTFLPEGITYAGDELFDYACASWRGIAYIYFGNPAAVYDADKPETKWANPATFTQITPVVYAQAVQVVGTVATKEQS